MYQLGAILALATLVSCSSSYTPLLDGLAVWSDDCSEIAVALNHSDFKNSVTTHYGTNNRFDIILADTLGMQTRTLVSQRKIDGQASQVTAIYYMKSAGFVLITAELLDDFAVVVERIDTSGVSTRLVTWNWTWGDTTRGLFIPSPDGSLIARIFEIRPSVSSPYNVSVSFLSSVDGAVVASPRLLFVDNSTGTYRWIDSLRLLCIARDLSAQVVSEAESTIRDTSVTCWYPATSSGTYCPARGYVVWDNSDNGTDWVLIKPTWDQGVCKPGM